MAKGNIKSKKKHEGGSKRLGKPASNSSGKHKHIDSESTIPVQAPDPVALQVTAREGLTTLTKAIETLEAGPGATIVMTHHLNPELQRKLGDILSSDPHVQIVEELRALRKEYDDVRNNLDQSTIELSGIKDEFARVLDSINLPLIIVGNDLRVQWCSPLAEPMLDMSTSGVDRKITSIKLSGHVPDFEAIISEVIATLKPMQEYVVDESGKWFSLLVYPYKTRENTVEGVVLTFSDVDEQKRNKTVPHSAGLHEQQFLDQARGVLMVLDIHQHVLMIGRSGCELVGWSEAEIVGKNWVDRFVPVNSVTAVRAVFDLIMRGELDDEYEYSVVTKGGEERIISWRSNVLRDEAGNVSGMICSGEDITILRKLNGALQRSEERLHVMMESVREDEFFIMDSEGYIISWIARPEEGKSFRAEEIVGQHFSRLYSSDDFQSGKPMRILDIAGNQGRFEEDGWRVRKDGTRMRAYVILTAIRDEARNLLGFSNVTRYIRENVETRGISSIQAPASFVTTA